MLCQGLVITGIYPGARVYIQVHDLHDVDTMQDKFSTALSGFRSIMRCYTSSAGVQVALLEHCPDFAAQHIHRAIIVTRSNFAQILHVQAYWSGILLRA